MKETLELPQIESLEFHTAHSSTVLTKLPGSNQTRHPGPEDAEAFANLSLGYTESSGSPALRKEVLNICFFRATRLGYLFCPFCSALQKELLVCKFLQCFASDNKI